MGLSSYKALHNIGPEACEGPASISSVVSGRLGKVKGDRLQLSWDWECWIVGKKKDESTP